MQIIWTLSVKPVDETHCEYTNIVSAHPTAAFVNFIAAHNISFEQAAAARQRDGGEHNRRENPLFAESIARRASAPKRAMLNQTRWLDPRLQPSGVSV